MLFIPHQGLTGLQDNQGTTSAEYGTTVTASATPHTKGSYSQLIASTSANAYGIFVNLFNTAVASTSTRVLVDIAVGAAASETIIIPDLIAGNAGTSAGAQNAGHSYYFPIVIPVGTRVAARCQALGVSDTVDVQVHLLTNPVPGKWYGQRVTAYGANTGTSSGTSMSPGNNTYATNVSLGTTSNRIKYMQVGTDLITDTTGTSSRGLIRISSGTTVLAGDLPYMESTTIESVDFTIANMILSHMTFSEPAGITLNISAMRSTTAEARGWAVYGVD